MFRIVLAAALLLFAAEATGLASLVAGDVCAGECADDGPDGQCPPACTCFCCSHVPPVASFVRGVLPLPDEEPLLFIERLATPASAEPRAIFHVPKPFLA